LGRGEKKGARDGNARTGRLIAAKIRRSFTRTNYRAVSASASASRVLWRQIRTFCCSTNRSARSTANANEFAKRIRRARKELNKTAVFVTHDLHEAFRLGTRICLMDKGKIVLNETPEIFAIGFAAR
jgi:serine acetyltransferase